MQNAVDLHSPVRFPGRIPPDEARLNAFYRVNTAWQKNFSQTCDDLHCLDV